MDRLDQRLLKALQADGRRKNADIARELGVAPSTVLDRTRRLEERGHLRGFRAIVDPKSLGLSVQALISVTLGRHSAETIRPFERGVRGIPYVRACYHVSGRFDYILHVAAKDLEHLGHLVKKRIAAIPGVDKTESFLVFSEVKSDVGWPTELNDEEEIQAHHDAQHGE
jgi:Lrp/AsnC family leucine-responsive transcriptional regulator